MRAELDIELLDYPADSVERAYSVRRYFALRDATTAIKFEAKMKNLSEDR